MQVILAVKASFPNGIKIKLRVTYDSLLTIASLRKVAIGSRSQTKVTLDKGM